MLGRNIKPIPKRDIYTPLQRSAKVIDKRNGCFVSGVLAIILHMARVLGAAPLQFVKKRTGWRIKLSKRFSIYGYVIITTTGIANAVTLVSFIFADSFRSLAGGHFSTDMVVWIVDVASISIIAGNIVYGAPRHMKSMITCLNHVQKINYELNVHHWPRSSEKMKILLIVILVIFNMFLVTTGMILVTLRKRYAIILSYVCRYLFVFIVQVKLMLFAMLTMHVVYSFRALNNCMRDLLYEMTESKMSCHSSVFITDRVFHMNQKYKNTNKGLNNELNSMTTLKTSGADATKSSGLLHIKVRRLALVYSSLCSVVREIDSCYGVMMFMMLGSFLFQLVVALFYFITSLFGVTVSTSRMMFALLMASQFVWCSYHSTNLAMVVEPCHLTQSEMEVTRELLSHLMHCKQAIYDPLLGELDLFFRRLILNQPSYGPMGVTTMSRSLIATIYASVTTYLVIILQL